MHFVPAAWIISALHQKITPLSGMKISGLQWLRPITSFSNLKIDSNKVTTLDGSNIFCKMNSINEANNISSEKFYKQVSEYTFIQKKEIYEIFRQSGYLYGPNFQTLQWAKIQHRCIKGCLEPTKDWGYNVSTALLDGGLQLAILLFKTDKALQRESNFIPFSLSECFITNFDLNDAIYCYCLPNEMTDSIVKCDFYYTNSKNEVIAKFIGLQSTVFTKTADATDYGIHTQPMEKTNVKVLHFD
jgi:hypothetical protein